MLKEFKAFALRGHVVDMAVGIVIGGAFGKMIASFVKDVLMPPIGLLMGGVDFSNLDLNLGSGSYDSLALAEKRGSLFFDTVSSSTPGLTLSSSLSRSSWWSTR